MQFMEIFLVKNMKQNIFMKDRWVVTWRSLSYFCFPESTAGCYRVISKFYVLPYLPPIILDTKGVKIFPGFEQFWGIEQKKM